MNWGLLVVVTTITALAAAGSCIGLRRNIDRFAVGGMAVGLLLYSGVGGAYAGMPLYYSALYVGLLIAMLLAFRLALLVPPLNLQPAAAFVGRYWAVVVCIYAILHLVPLVVPVFRLGLLLQPPRPDIRAAFAQRFDDVDPGLIASLTRYGVLMLAPLFYCSLSRLKDRLVYVWFLLGAVLYLRFVETAYIGRGTIVVAAIILCVGTWQLRPDIRTKLIAGVIVATPMIVFLFDAYGALRLGRVVHGGSVSRSMVALLENETRFPAEVGMAIIESPFRADLLAYVRWIVTLPIPKIVTGEIEGARINYEIAEIALGRLRGRRGFYVPLAGLAAESVYLFGKTWFWLHGLTLGFVLGLSVALLRQREFAFLQGAIVALAAYTVNRGGVSALLPALVNIWLVIGIALLAQRLGGAVR